jgi:hypothetical protein
MFACDIRLSGVYSNKLPLDAYRGAGRPVAAYVISRRCRVSKPKDLEIADGTVASSGKINNFI